MRKHSICILALLVFIVAAAPAFAVSGWGKINDIFSYDKMSIKESGTRCLVSCVIKNNSDKMQEGIFISIYGWDNFGELKWKVTEFFDVIPARGEAKFSEIVRSCKEDNPHKMTFKVTGAEKP